MTIQTAILTAIETGAVVTISTYVTHIGVGTGTSTPAITQTQLDAETYREAVFATASTANTFTTSLYLDVTENLSNTVSEIGVFNASSSGTMVSRNNTTSVYKTSSKELYYDIKYTISATNN